MKTVIYRHKLRTLFLTVLSFTSIAQADVKTVLGPMPHERMNTPKKANANVGRYAYVGTLPKFKGSDLELTVSKMSLTLRATGWISQEKVDGYAAELYKRWELLDQALNDSEFVLHPLVNLMSLPTKDTSIAWAKIASQYSSHVLENRGLDVYTPKRNTRYLEGEGKIDDYKSTISEAVLRYFFNNNSLKGEHVKADNQLRNNLLSVNNSRVLFNTHHGDKFTRTSEKSGYLGFLTVVYPIAATTAGPNDQPAEGTRNLMDYGTIDSRWWSDKWDDEFAGLPFILINPSGVAFHGPITNFAPLDVWYLRRGYVSHGCHRMDASDVIELRTIMPASTKDLGKVKITILNNFDVTDWNRDGKLEVVDVKYYNIPTSVAIAKGKTIDDVISPYLIENQQKSFYTTHAYAKKYYDVSSDQIKGAVKYSTVGGKLVRDGVHGDLPLMRFNYPKSRILQYQELNVQMIPYDDNRGKYPPKYFFR